MTGRNPGAHGVYAFWRLGTHSYEPGGIANASDLRTPTLWDLAGRGGRRVGVVNVPPSYPIRPVNGYVVSCMLTPPGEPFTSPPELAAELDGYQIDVRAPAGLRPGSPGYEDRARGFLEALRGQTERRTAATLRLMQTRPTDLLSVVFYAPDRVQHFFWHLLEPGGAANDGGLRDVIESVYRTVDASVGRLVATAGEDANVIVISDHGFTSKPDRSVRINRWLADADLLHERPLWKLRRRLVRRALPARWQARYDAFDRTVNPARSQAWSERIETTTAAIWVHVRGRYPLGCVEPGEQYEGVRRRIQEGLGALRDEAGRPVFRGVHRREDIYRGAHVEKAPDLVAVCDERFGLVYQSLRRDLRSRGLFGPWGELDYTGTHRPEGVYVFAGPAIQALGSHREYPIESIAPTTLHLLDLPVPRSMDGPVCTTLLREDFLAAHPVRYEEAGPEEAEVAADWRSEADEAKIADHLRALGYLE